MSKNKHTLDGSLNGDDVKVFYEMINEDIHINKLHVYVDEEGSDSGSYYIMYSDELSFEDKQELEKQIREDKTE